MDLTLALKIFLTPALIGAASLAGRRWGPSVSGWLVGLPLTSGPITFLVALSFGTAFAKSTAMGTLLGTASQMLVCLVYAWVSKRWAWPLSLLASVAVFAASTWLLKDLHLSLPFLFGVILTGLSLVLIAFPKEPAGQEQNIPLPRWDIPARMVLVTAYVITLTTLAPRIGPQLTGLITPFPLYALVLATFGQHHGGSKAAIQVMRGLTAGLFSFAIFFCVLAATIETLPLWQSFTLAAIAVIIVQGMALWVLTKKRN